MARLAKWAAALLALAASAAAKAIDGVFIVELPSSGVQDPQAQFQKAALNSSIDYSVRYVYDTPDVFVGLSIQVTDNSSDTTAKLSAIPGVVAVHPVWEVANPSAALVNGSSPLANTVQPGAAAAPSHSVYPTPGPNANLGSALQMAGIDKLHAAGITGAGIKVGIIDTGVDYRHPALGGGFGPGFKIAGGYSFVNDNGNEANSSDPLVTCYGGGHGTHVSGIVGMEPLAPGQGFNITGVAPSASIYMYRVFGCSGGGGSDTVVMALLKAQSDGVNVINMSLNFGEENPLTSSDPVATVCQSLFNAGIAVIVANGNDEGGASTGGTLYAEGQPSELPNNIGVGAITNTNFPLVYTAVDSSGAHLSYASLWPISSTSSVDVMIISDGCQSSVWSDAITALVSAGTLNTTVIGFPVTDQCSVADANDFGGGPTPWVIMGLYQNTTDPYHFDYDIPSPGYFGTAQAIALNIADATTLSNNYAAASGNYKLTFNNGVFSSPPQHVAGLMDYYSDFGPVWHTYELKPQLSAPAGHVLSTWPLGTYGNYSILSGTSMATPYITGIYALLKSKFPSLSVSQITALMQTNSVPTTWVYNASMLAATSQQGAGLVNAYAAVQGQSRISPGQLIVSDNSRTTYGVVNITIANLASQTLTYTLSHRGAGYGDYLINYMEPNQEPIFGSAHFPTPTVTVGPSKTATVTFTISPPPATAVNPSAQPVFGGFIGVQASDNQDFSVPYVGPPYSLYNAEYLYIAPSLTTYNPGIWYAYDGQDTPVYDPGLMSINSSLPFGSAFGMLQYSTSVRVDVVPANTTFVPTHYGYDTSVTYKYQPSSNYYESHALGGTVPTYGYLFSESGIVCPCQNWAPEGTGLTVTGDSGATYPLGPGDYRWLVSILRWGGDPSIQTDYETWLGPVLRMKNGPVSPPSS